MTMTRPKVVTTAEARADLDSLLKFVIDQGGEVIIEHHKQPAAVIVSFDLYQKPKRVFDARQSPQLTEMTLWSECGHCGSASVRATKI
jgi:hypothetical protein